MSSDVVLVGKKRKRYAPTEKDVSVKLTGKLYHGLKEIRKAAKKAKAFETQRLVKKLKDLRKPVRNPETVSEDIKDLEAQLESLKTTDHERIAHIALSSKLRKDKILSSNDALGSAIAPAASSTIEAKPEAWHAKTESRLLSSKFLAVEVGSVLSGLRAVLEPESMIRTEGELRTLRTDGVEERGEVEASDGELEIDAKKESFSTDGDRSAEDEDSGQAASLDDAVDETDHTVDDGGWESGSIHHDAQMGTDGDDSGSSAPPSKRLKQLSSTRRKLQSSEQSDSAAASTFLPSLSVGFIKGDPDSDFDESEGETAETGRKNRRGQRARQAIWEKKYGKNAKHIKKQRENSEAVTTARALGKRPDSGWAGHREASLTNRGRGQGPGSKPPSRTANSSHRGTEGKQPADRPNHPSWEAKKKLKEKEGARILPSQGKKIVFT